jgi:hypothetical protein
VEGGRGGAVSKLDDYKMAHLTCMAITTAFLPNLQKGQRISDLFF